MRLFVYGLCFIWLLYVSLVALVVVYLVWLRVQCCFALILLIVGLVLLVNSVVLVILCCIVFYCL